MGRPAVLKVEIVGDARKAQSAARDTETSFGKIGGGVGKLAGLAKTGFAAVVVAAGAAGIASGKSASDLQQSAGAVETVFGRSSKAVKNYAATADQALGLSTSAYENMASIIGTQLQNMGQSQAQSVQGTQALIQKGADLAATFGGTTSDAVEALSSLMKGESDPIERYGVSILQSDVNARLASQGLDKLTGSALKTAEGQARLSLLNEQTSKTTGAFGRESDTAAGKTQRLSAQTENLKAAVGAKLLPAYTAVVGFISAKALPALTSQAQVLSTKLQPAVAAVSSFVTGKLVPAFQAVGKWINDYVVPAVKTYLAPVLASVKTAFANVSKSVSDNKEGLGKLGTAINKVGEFLTPLAKLAGGAAADSINLLGKAVGFTIKGIAGLANGIDTAIQKFEALKDKASNVAGGIGNVLGKLGLGSGPQLLGDAGAAGMVAPGYGPGGPLATAAGGDLPGALLAAAAGGGAPLIVVDRRTFTAPAITVTGALDPVAVARQLQRLLDEYRITIGQTPAYGGAAL